MNVMEKYLLERKAINSRLLIARIKGKGVDLTLVQCYVQAINGDDDITKDSFYEKLHV